MRDKGGGDAGIAQRQRHRAGARGEEMCILDKQFTCNTYQICPFLNPDHIRSHVYTHIRTHKANTHTQTHTQEHQSYQPLPHPLTTTHVSTCAGMHGHVRARTHTKQMNTPGSMVKSTWMDPWSWDSGAFGRSKSILQTSAVECIDPLASPVFAQ
jgi:hypothetical protein